MRFYIPVYFFAEELLPPEIYKQGDQGFFHIDARILVTLDRLCECPLFPKSGSAGGTHTPIVVNNWFHGGPFSQRGLRTDTAMLLKTPNSQHRYGRAADCDIQGVTPDEFRAMAKAGKLNHELEYINGIEEGVNWCHIDCGATPDMGITYFTA
jgi:hypothetical protein